jgi:hypothetical protein
VRSLRVIAGALLGAALGLAGCGGGGSTTTGTSGTTPAPKRGPAAPPSGNVSYAPVAKCFGGGTSITAGDTLAPVALVAERQRGGAFVLKGRNNLIYVFVFRDTGQASSNGTVAQTLVRAQVAARRRAHQPVNLIEHASFVPVRNVLIVQTRGALTPRQETEVRACLRQGLAPGSPAAASYSHAEQVLQTARDTLNRRAVADTRSNSIPGLRRDAYDFRVALYRFDRAVRGITFPWKARGDVSALLDADRKWTADLDAMARTKTLAQFKTLVGRNAKDRAAEGAAEDRVKQDLGLA